MLGALIACSSSIPIHATESSVYLVGNMSVEHLLNQYPAFKSQYENYQVDDRVDLSGILDMDIVIMFGVWCHDSEREVPRMLRILEEVGLSSQQISLIGVDIRKQEPKGREKIFNLKSTPTFIFFLKGEEVGRIIESPVSSLETDLHKMTL